MKSFFILYLYIKNCNLQPKIRFNWFAFFIISFKLKKSISYYLNYFLNSFIERKTNIKMRIYYITSIYGIILIFYR